MTNQEHQKVIEIYGEDYQPLDVPAYIRQREEKLALKDEAILEQDADWAEKFSSEYPLGGMLEPYDIERDKEI